MNNFFKDNIRAISILLICLAILVGLIALGGKQLKDSLPMVGTPMVGVSGTLEEKEIAEQSGISLSVSNRVLNDDAMSYGDFVQTYGQKRIQFGENCSASPTSASFVVGDILILDNRSSKVQAVRFIDDLYALPPYHVRIFKLERQGIFDIDCGSSKNVSRIMVH